MTKFAIVFSIFVLSVFATVGAGTLNLTIVNGEIVCGDGEVVRLTSSQSNLNIISFGELTTLGTGTALESIHVTPFDPDSQLASIADATIYPFFPTVDSFKGFSFWSQTIELQPLDSFPEILSFDPALNELYISNPAESYYVVFVPEPASLVLFGIGGLLISKRRNK